MIVIIICITIPRTGTKTLKLVKNKCKMFIRTILDNKTQANVLKYTVLCG